MVAEPTDTEDMARQAGWVVAVAFVCLVAACTEAVDTGPDGPSATSTTAATTPTTAATGSATTSTTAAPAKSEPPVGMDSVELAVDPGDVPLEGSLFVSADGIARAVYVAGESRIDLAVCVDRPCSSVTIHQVLDTAPAQIDRLVAAGFEGSGAPVVVYAASDGGDFINGAEWCENSDCTTTSGTEISRNTDGRRPLAAAEPSFAVTPDGRCLGAAGFDDIYLAECTDGYRLPDTSNIVVNEAGLGPVVLGVGIDGLPVMVIERQEGPVTDIGVLPCADAECAEVGRFQQIFVGEAGVPLRAHPPLISGSRVTIFIEATSSEGIEEAQRFVPARLVALGCDDRECDEPRGGVVESFVQASASALGADGLPRLAWTNQNGQVILLRCEDVSCSTFSAQPLETRGFLFDMAVAGDRVFFLIEDAGRLSIVTWSEGT